MTIARIACQHATHQAEYEATKAKQRKRQEKHQGFATENYKFGHGPQKFVLKAIIDRFDLKLRKETWKQDLVQQVRALKGKTYRAYVVKADIGETLYNIDNKKS